MAKVEGEQQEGGLPPLDECQAGRGERKVAEVEGKERGWRALMGRGGVAGWAAAGGACFGLVRQAC